MDIDILMGSSPAKIDDKGRLKVPVGFRKIIEEKYGTGCFITSPDGDHAIVYPLGVWYDFQARLLKMPKTSVAGQKYLERLMYFGQVSSIDAQGRILIPTVLRTKASIADDVVVLGKGDHLVVWNEERFERRLGETPLTAEDYKELELHGV